MNYENITDVKARLDEINTDLEKITSEAQEAKRELTADEETQLEELSAEKEELIEIAEELIAAIEVVDETIDEVVDDEPQEASKRTKIEKSKLNTKTRMKNETTKNTVSLGKMIRNIVLNKPLDAEQSAVVARGQKEAIESGCQILGQIVIPQKRAAYQATVIGQGIENVATELQDVVQGAFAKLVFKDAGSTFYTNLVGNQQFPLMGNTNCDWQSETGTSIDGAGQFKSINMMPKRLTCFVDISKQMLLQDNSQNIDTLITQNIVQAISNKLENTILSNIAASTLRPGGLFDMFTPSVLTPTYQELAALEAALLNDNIHGAKSIIMNPSIREALKTTPKDAGSGLFLMGDNEEVMGYKAYTTSNSFGFLLGDFSKHIIANWGGVDLTIDAATQAINGVVRIVVNTFWDSNVLYDTALDGHNAPIVASNI